MPRQTFHSWKTSSHAILSLHVSLVTRNAIPMKSFTPFWIFAMKKKSQTTENITRIQMIVQVILQRNQNKNFLMVQVILQRRKNETLPTVQAILQQKKRKNLQMLQVILQPMKKLKNLQAIPPKNLQVLQLILHPILLQTLQKAMHLRNLTLTIPPTRMRTQKKSSSKGRGIS